MEQDLFGWGQRKRPPRRALVRSADGWDMQSADREPITISALNSLAKQTLETQLPAVLVRGEVAAWKRHGPTGHCYFSLCDDRAQVRCVMFRADAQRLPTDPDDGMDVRAFGTLTLYEKKGDFQFVVRELEGAGADGLWRLAFEKLRRRLEAEGLLAPERKRPLPRHPRAIGVVTSPVGAALHDILNVVRRRAPWTRVLLSPARVQGEGAGADIARAIERINAHGVADVIIVGRGGGSRDDLWAFNEEVVARAIALSQVPVISAVGHEVDVTIADLVADERAPTPSAAAERAVPDMNELLRSCSASAQRLERALLRRIGLTQSRLDTLARDLDRSMERAVEKRRRRMDRCAEMLDALSPLAALGRGYAVPLDGDRRVLRRVADFPPGTPFSLRVTDGTVDCEVRDGG